MAGVSVSHLAQAFDLCSATIRSYIKAYHQGGIEGLRPGKSSGRPPKVGQLSKADWEEILHQSPNTYEKLCTDCRCWSLELLARYAQRYLGQEVCFQTISAALRRCKYRTGRSKLRIGSPDPEYQVKRQRIEELSGLPPRDN
jgi:transposase